jgi:hypothetical protein
MRRGRAVKNEILRESLKLIRDAGLKPRVDRGRHWKITWVDQHGRQQRLTVSFSPSDRRARRQSRAVLRRLLRTSKPPGSGEIRC